MKRRLFLQTGLGAAQIGLAASAGLLLPVAALATGWPADAFYAVSFEGALARLFAGEPVQESEHVHLDAEAIAENGSTVPVTVRTDLPGALTVTLFSVSNPTPAVGRFELSARLDGHLTTRIKMAKSGDVVAVVTANGKHYSARRRIQVTAGGCA